MRNPSPTLPNGHTGQSTQFEIMSSKEGSIIAMVWPPQSHLLTPTGFFELASQSWTYKGRKKPC